MNSTDPWRVSVLVAQIPDTGLHRVIEANGATRGAMADAAGLREIISVKASFDLKLKSNGRVHVTGQVKAQVGQTCVVTLDPIVSEIDETVDLIFAPPEQIPTLAVLTEEAAQSEDGEVPDPPEPIVNGAIYLGRLAMDVLFLGIDPYPRRPDAVFERPVEVVDSSDHPFASLKVLQAERAATQTNKAARKPNDEDR